jgi:hypothetical protein
MALPLSIPILQDPDRLREHLRRFGGPLSDRKLAAQVGAQLTAELGSDLNDLVKIQHPQWQSGWDIPIGGLAIATSGLELWSACQNHDSARELLSGAQLGANFVDLASSAAGFLGGIAPAIQGCCFVVRTVAGLLKVCIAWKESEAGQ